MLRIIRKRSHTSTKLDVREYQELCSRLISSCHGKAVHEVTLCSTGIIGFCPNMSSTGIYLVVMLCVVLLAHNAYGNNHDQSPIFPSQAFARAFTIELCPHSTFPFASGLYAMVNDNLTSILEKNSLNTGSFETGNMSHSLFHILEKC